MRNEAGKRYSDNMIKEDEGDRKQGTGFLSYLVGKNDIRIEFTQ